MKLNIKNLVSENNGGDGIRIIGDVDLNFDSAQVRGNRGHGVYAISGEQVKALQMLGLSHDQVDPKDLGTFLEGVARLPVADREAEVRHSSFGNFVSSLANGSEILNKILTIALDPNIHSWIERLMPK